MPGSHCRSAMSRSCWQNVSSMFSNETVRRWFLKFGRLIARNLRRSRPRPSPRWHIDEIVIRIRDRKYWLWRAVDDESEVLEVLVQHKRDRRTALRLVRKLLRKHGGCPRAVVTDCLRSYRSALCEMGLERLHETGRWKNNRAEVSHQPVRRRERQRLGFRSPGPHSDFFPSMQPSTIYSTFNAT